MKRTCPTGKTRMRTAYGARTALVWSITYGRSHRACTRFYKCHKCEGFHLTSMALVGNRWPDGPHHAGIYTQLTLPGHDAPLLTPVGHTPGRAAQARWLAEATGTEPLAVAA